MSYSYGHVQNTGLPLCPGSRPIKKAQETSLLTSANLRPIVFQALDVQQLPRLGKRRQCRDVGLVLKLLLAVLHHQITAYESGRIHSFSALIHKHVTKSLCPGWETLSNDGRCKFPAMRNLEMHIRYPDVRRYHETVAMIYGVLSEASETIEQHLSHMNTNTIHTFGFTQDTPG